MLQLGACHLGIYLRRGDVRVTEYLAYCLNRHTVFQGQYCKRVPTNVVRDSFLDATHCSHFLDALVDSVKSADIEQVAVLSQWLVSLNNLHRNIHQLDLKRHACLLTLGNYPRSTVYHTDVVLRQVLCVNERDTCPTAKNEKVSCKCHVWVFQLYLGHGGKLVQGQELTLLVVWVNVVHGKRVSRYLAVVVCCHDDMLQRYGVYPNGGLRKPYNVLQVQAKVTDELLGKLIHCHVAALVLKLDELGNVLSYHKILAISPNSSVFAHTFGKGCVLLVKGSEQCLVLHAYALISVSHHFSGNERLTVGKSLVMLGDLSLDVVKRKVHLLGFLASSLCSVALGIPYRLAYALLAAELCDSSVDCHSSHDRDNSVSLLASIYIEDCLKCTSHNSLLLFGAKLNHESCMANSKPVQNGEVRTEAVKYAY